MKPVKLLRCTLSNVSVKSTATVNGTTNVAYQWNATLAVVAQAHSDSTTPTPFFYNGNDVRVGDFITTSGDGKSLKVASITTKTANSVVRLQRGDHPDGQRELPVCLPHLHRRRRRGHGRHSSDRDVILIIK